MPLPLLSNKQLFLLFLPLLGCISKVTSTLFGGCRRTVPATEGPYYVKNSPYRNGSICENSDADDRLMIYGRVVDLSSNCLTGVPATIELWHANYLGQYSALGEKGRFGVVVPQYMKALSGTMDCRSKIDTDPQGYYQFSTTIPGRYLNGVYPGDYRPAHVHFKVTANVPGYETLTTQMYFENDKYISPDIRNCPMCRSEDASLKIQIQSVGDAKTFVGLFNVVLQKGVSGTDPYDANEAAGLPPPTNG